MRALFGEGLHPEADAITTARIAEGDTASAAVGAAKLGRAFPSFAAVPASVQAELAAQVAAFRAENGRAPDRTERNCVRDTAAREVFTRTQHRAPAESEVAGLLGGEKRAPGPNRSPGSTWSSPPRSRCHCCGASAPTRSAARWSPSTTRRCRRPWRGWRPRPC
jgi:hypothetical protein